MQRSPRRRAGRSRFQCRRGYGVPVTGRSGIALAMLCLALGGCGGASTPPGTPRATVLGFIDDLRARRTTPACAVLDRDEKRSIRLGVLGGLRAPGATVDQRLRYIQHMNAATKRCPVALRVLADELDRQLPRIRTAVANTTVTKLGPAAAHVWVLGDQDWVVEPRNGRWVITGTNALSIPG